MKFCRVDNGAFGQKTLPIQPQMLSKETGPHSFRLYKKARGKVLILE